MFLRERLLNPFEISVNQEIVPFAPRRTSDSWTNCAKRKRNLYARTVASAWIVYSLAENRFGKDNVALSIKWHSAVEEPRKD